MIRKVDRLALSLIGVRQRGDCLSNVADRFISDLRETIAEVDRLNTTAGASLALDDFLSDVGRRLMVKISELFPGAHSIGKDEMRELIDELLQDLVAEGWLNTIDKDLEELLREFFVWSTHPGAE